MHAFKSLARAFLGSPTMQQAFKNKTHIPPLCFGKPSERWPMTVSSLTKVSSFLNVSAQPRKSVREAICSQGHTAPDMDRCAWGDIDTIKIRQSLGRRSPTEGTRMGQQIVAHYLKFLHDSTSFDLDSTSWMRLSPAKFSDSQVLHKWQDILEMFNDIMNCLRSEKRNFFILQSSRPWKKAFCRSRMCVDRIGYKETRYQESLVQKKLTKALGHPSQCLFTLLQFYLDGSIEDMEIEICGGVSDNGGKANFRLRMGNILTSNEEKIVQSGVKQLDRL